jgi:hypothetical protein
MADSSKLTEPAAHARFWNFSRRWSRLSKDADGGDGTSNSLYADSLFMSACEKMGEVREGRLEAGAFWRGIHALLCSISVAAGR